MLTLIFCVFVGILHTSLGEPNLDTAPLTIESVRGKQVILPCVVKNLGFSSIIWFAPSGTAIAKDTHLYVTDNRISMQHEYDSDFHIVIENVKEGDQGVYICMVMGGMDEKRVTLVVKSPPTIDDQRSSPNAIIIREGETLNLRCSANGKPVPTINWYRSTEKDDGQMVKEDLSITGAVLSVANFERESSGSYQCVASNGLLPNVSREMIVTVHFKPTIYSNDNDIFSKRPGQTVILECIAEGFPLPAVEWQRNGETIKETERSRKYRISNDKTMDTVILTLRINDLEDHDFGIYTCLARNIYGQASHDYSVEKTGAPKIEISSPLIRKMKSENAEFECRVRGFPRGVVWFKDGERIIPNRQTSIENYKEDDIYVSSLTVLTLTATEFGIYVCQADNEYGSDEIEIRLEQSAIDVSGPTEASVGGDIAIVCNATTNSVDEDSITWLKNGQPLKTSNRISISRDINVKEQRIYSKLYISDMKIGDKGTYTCKTKNYLLRSHTLSILELPDEFVSIDKEASSPETVIVQGNGDDFELLCEVEAYPRKMVYWLKYLGTREGKEMYQELSSGNEILPLRNEKASAGTYRCRASNGRKAEETLDITVDIQYGVKVSVPNHRIRNIIGMPLSLECNITGNPILWTLWVSPNGPDSAFDHVLDIETHENYVIAAMKVTKMNLEDFGTYTCVGGNHLGNDSTKVAVFPIFPTTTTSPKPTTYTMKPIRKTTTEKLVEVQTPKETQTAMPVVKTSTIMADIVSEATTRRPRPTKQSIQTDKDRVRQDDSSGNSVYFSSSCQLLLTLTVFLTFRIIYS